MTTSIDWDALERAAAKVRENAHAPYSGFRVGAAIQTDDGRIFTGCNVENASYGATLCAERGALAGAVAAGSPHPIALVIVTEAPRPTPPCGLCRQSLIELGPDLQIRSVGRGGVAADHQLSELLPEAFDREQLE